MSLPLTPEVLRYTYDFLNSTLPFRQWNLPDGDDVAFKVIRSPTLFGWYDFLEGRHVIAISARTIGHTDTLIRVMAHEMIHLHQKEVKIDHHETQHNAAFWALAKEVSRIHGFDPKAF